MDQRVTSSQLWSGNQVVSLYPGLGVLGSLIPTTGDSGASPLANDGIDPDLEYRMEVITPPSAGVLRFNPDTSFEFTDAPEGSYSFTYEGFETGTSYGTMTDPLTVGSQAESTISATLGNILFSGASFSPSISTISAQLGDILFSGQSLVGTVSTIDANLGDIVFSGTSYSKTVSEISATLDDIVFSGTSFSAQVSTISAVLGDIAFSGSSVSGSAAISSISATIGDIVFSGASSSAGVAVWPAEADVRLGVTYGPTGSDYTGTLLPGSGSYPTAEEIAAAVMASLSATTLDVNAVSGAWPTTTQTADAVWTKVLP